MKRKPNKLLLALIGVAHLGITAWTWRDIQRRPADQIRGNKTFCRTVSTLNSGNSAIYWLFGRRRHDE